MTCFMCKTETLTGHCDKPRAACAWYRCLSCSTVIDVARRLAWLPSHRVVELG
jgi:hypothetical protein